jgi:limonene-1,2-epoxide hydrolase
MTPSEFVSDFISAFNNRDLEAAIAMVDHDCEYDNVPMGKVVGPDGIRASLAPFLANCDQVEWLVSHQVESGNMHAGVVMNERVDRFHLGDRWMEIAVAGLFVIRNAKLVLWRDYFDKQTFIDQMSS